LLAADYRLKDLSSVVVLVRSWDSSVNIGPWLWAGWSGVRCPAGARDFSFQNFQASSEAYPTSYPVGTSVIFPRVKRPGREVDHWPQYNAGVEDEWSYTSAPPIHLHGMYGDSFVFHLLVLNNYLHGADLSLESWQLLSHSDSLHFIEPEFLFVTCSYSETNQSSAGLPKRFH
jgi:hypothetical protein